MLTLEAYLARQSRHADTTNTVFRVLLSLIFIVGGLGHFGQTKSLEPDAASYVRLTAGRLPSMLRPGIINMQAASGHSKW